MKYFILILVLFSNQLWGQIPGETMVEKFADYHSMNDEKVQYEKYRTNRDESYMPEFYKWHSPAELLPMLDGITKDDFLVNDDLLGSATQYEPAVAIDQAGNYVAVWQDNRNGHSAIYGQRYQDGGRKVGDNFQVSEELGYLYAHNPDIAMDEQGNFVVVWDDYRNGRNNLIYAQRYDYDGNPVGENFCISSDQENSCYDPSISIAGSSGYVIVWDERSTDNSSEIYARRFDIGDIPFGTSFLVNDDSSQSRQDNPTVSINKAGNFVITWEDYRGGNCDIYGQLYLNDGAAVGKNFRVNGDTTETTQNRPDIGMDEDGNFTITWLDGRDAQGYYDYDIYAQRFNSSGNLIGENFKVNSEMKISRWWGMNPAITMDTKGNFIILWPGYQNYPQQIFGQYFTSDGQPIFGNFSIGDGHGYQYNPAASMNDKQNLVAVWIDNRENNDDVYGQVFSELGVRSGENYKINDDIGSASQREPKPDIAANGDMMIVWEDERNGFSNYIYGQFYTGNGQPADTNIQISEKTGYDPAISMNSQGESIIVWDDYSGITAQRFTSSRQRFFSNFQITANKRGEYYNSDPQAAIDDENNFIVIWKKRLEAEQETDIYGQRYNQYGQPIGNQFVVNDTSNSLPYNSYRFQIAIETGKNGNFCVFWLNSIDNKYHIIGQRFSDNGTPDGNNFIVDDNESSLYSPSIRTGIDEEGNVIITWDDHRNGSFDIYAQRYAKDGHPIGSNFKVNDDNGFAGQSSPSIAVAPNGSFVISWIDYRFEFNQPYIIGQRYGANGEPVGSNYIIVDGSQWHSQLYPAVAANSNQIVFTWQDNRRLKGWDIYAKIAGWDWDGFTSVEREKKIPQQYALGNNYPNPFNPITTIAYDLPKVSNVKIEVFNMLGQKVALVIDKKQPAGCYKIQFDAGFLASGLYYYRIEADEFIQTKKMVLLK